MVLWFSILFLLCSFSFFFLSLHFSVSLLYSVFFSLVLFLFQHFRRENKKIMFICSLVFWSYYLILWFFHFTVYYSVSKSILFLAILFDCSSIFISFIYLFIFFLLFFSLFNFLSSISLFTVLFHCSVNFLVLYFTIQYSTS